MKNKLRWRMYIKHLLRWKFLQFLHENFLAIFRNNNFLIKLHKSIINPVMCVPGLGESPCTIRRHLKTGTSNLSLQWATNPNIMRAAIKKIMCL